MRLKIQRCLGLILASVGMAAVLALTPAYATPASKGSGAGPDFPFLTAVVLDRAKRPQFLASLAEQVLPTYRQADRTKYLDTLFRLQLVANRYADALQSLRELRALHANDPSHQMRVGTVQYEIYAHAKILEREARLSFASAFARAFHDIVDPLDNRQSALVVRSLNIQETGGLSLIIDMQALRDRLERDFAKEKGKTAISLDDAVKLIRDYQVEETYRSMEPFAGALVADDDRRRYVIDSQVPVKTSDGATVCALIVRPRDQTGPLPTLMEFSVYADISTSMSEARRNASNNYVGVEGFTRGKLCSSGAIWPEEHDGADAAALIDWIAKQPWSDGRVGMFGASYSGFTEWAAAKYMPHALKAMMAGVTLAPGIDSPAEGNIIQGFSYYWPFYVASNKTLDGRAFDDTAQWQRLFNAWYVKGRAYRDLDDMYGKPNPVWDRWLDHPAYDAYWQHMIPFGTEFARVGIPVLTTTGYYDGGEVGALYYYQQHHKYSPRAEHYFVIGPYDHGSGNRGTVNVMGDDVGVLDGYKLDAAAHIDLGELRYQWFDYVFRHGPKPAILQDRINYEVMGANTWRHAPSIAAMADGKQRFYLGNVQSKGAYRLDANRPTESGFIAQSLNFADRSDVNRVAPGGDIVDSAIDTWESLEFVSNPMQESVDVSGLFSGHLDFVINKKDFDFFIQLYELTPEGKYFELSWYMARASYLRDRSHRQLLEPGVPTQLDFTNERLTSRRLAAGSRLVVVLSLIKQPNTEINYGSGKPVGEETIKDAGAPLKVHWLNDSFIDIPVSKP